MIDPLCDVFTLHATKVLPGLLRYQLRVLPRHNRNSMWRFRLQRIQHDEQLYQDAQQISKHLTNHSNHLAPYNFSNKMQEIKHLELFSLHEHEVDLTLEVITCTNLGGQQSPVPGPCPCSLAFYSFLLY